ncbi:MAG: hypothetical protein ACI35O_12445 [Bacillaceae bacterium]
MFKEDGAIGTVVFMKEDKYLIVWEDYVLSWVTKEQIQLADKYKYTIFF